MSTYWQKRSVDQLYEAMRDAEKVADKISTVYMKASLWLDQEASDIFERFKTKWKLTDEEAYRLIEAAGSRLTVEKLQQAYQATGGKNTELMREMESQAFRSRLERLADISLQLDAVMQKIYRQEVSQTAQFYKDLAKDQYYKTIFSLHQRAGYGFSFAHVSEKQIDRMLQMKWYGKNYSERIWGNAKELAEDLSKEMLVSLITGRTDRETAEIFNQKFGAGAIKSRRLIRTEAAWVSSQMVLAGYQESGIKEYMFLATLDLRTSQLCRDHDGLIYPVEKYEIGKTAPPLHPWCRSTTVAVIDRGWLKNHTRIARNAEGRNIKVPMTMTYDEWYMKYIKGNPTGEAEEKKVRNKADDRKQYEEYRKILGDDIPDSFVKFQDMKYNDPEKWNVIHKRIGLLRKSRNTGPFSHLPERMTKKHVREVARHYGIDIKGVSISIDKNEELLNIPITGRADHENIGGITFFPNAFRSEEELLRTLFHEKQHVMQYKEHGTEYVQNNRAYFEKITSDIENEFISNLKSEGRL